MVVPQAVRLTLGQKIAMDAEAICRFELFRRMEEGLQFPLTPTVATALADEIATSVVDHFDILDEQGYDVEGIIHAVCRDVTLGNQ